MGAETWAAIGKFIYAVAFGAGATASAGYVFAVNVARVAVLALAAKLTTPKLDLSQAAREKLVTIRDSLAPQTFTYGEDMVSGPILYSRLSGTSVLNNDQLHFIVALAGHEIDSYRSYQIDDTTVELTDLSGSYDGTVNAGRFNGVAQVDAVLGTATQAVLPLANAAFPGFWTANHRARGWAIIGWRFDLVNGLEAAFEQGAPQNLRSVIRGYRVYDPRLDSTNGGTGTHRVNDPTTWEWSANPALCLAHFIMDTKFGMKETSSRIDWAMVITAANICDATVSIPGPSSQPRYTCNATFQSTEPRRDVRDTLLGAMMGRMVFSQGLWKMWAGAAVTPDVTLTEANLAGAIQLQASTGAKERYNMVRGKFIDPTRGYQANAYPTQFSSVYIAADGGEEREQVADMLHTNNGYEAQRKAIIFLRQSRNQRVVVFQGNLSCFRLQPGATVLLDVAEYGFAGEKFFITQWAFTEEGAQLTLVEEDDTVWADPVIGDYSTHTVTGVLTSQSTGVFPPTSGAASSLLEGVLITWANPAAHSFDHIEVWGSNTNVRGNAVLIGTTSAERFIESMPWIEKRTRYYWLRSIDQRGRVSDWHPNLTTTTITNEPTTDQPSWIPDPTFDLLDTDPVNEFWSRFVLQGTGASQTGDITISLGNGQDSISNAMDLIPSGGTGARSELSTRKRIAFKGQGVWVIQIRYITVGSADSADHENIITAVDSEDRVGSTISSIGGGAYTVPRSGSWTTFEFVVDNEALTPPITQTHVGFSLQWGSTGVTQGTLDTLRIDTMTAQYIGRSYNNLAATTLGKPAGLVPPSAAAESSLFLRGDGVWGTPSGSGVDSFNGRIGAVSPQQADYDSFFLTPAEGNAAYAPVSHNHAATQITSGTLPVARGGTGVTTSTGTGNTVRSASPTFTGTITAAIIAMVDNLLTRPYIQDYAIVHQNVTGVASTTINYSSGQSVNLQLSAANVTTLTISNWPATGRFGCLEILVTQGATPRTVAWPAAVNWPGGVAPDLNVANGRFLVYLRTVDAGTNIEGTYTPAMS